MSVGYIIFFSFNFSVGSYSILCYFLSYAYYSMVGGLHGNLGEERPGYFHLD